MLSKQRLNRWRWLLAIASVLGLGQTRVQAAPVLLYGAEQFVLHSKITGEQYTIYLSVPAVAPPAGGYPVLYALDGDASFAPLHLANPRQASVFSMLAQHVDVLPDPGVVVGIGYGKDFYQTFSQRTRDYTIAGDPGHGGKSAAGTGGAAAFSRFLTQELKPAIAARLPVNPARQSLLGHSFGGLFTLYQMLTNPQAFQGYFAISPSIWFADRALLTLPAAGPAPALLTIWVGEEEEISRVDDPLKHPQLARLSLRQQKNRMIGNARAFVDKQSARPDLLVDFRIIPAHDHGEMATYAYDRVLALAFAPGLTQNKPGTESR
jgi:predicted alpha/beta superfamily hydrolase